MNPKVVNVERIGQKVDDLLAELAGVGFDRNDPHIQDTPRRVARAFTDDFLRGYQERPEDLFTSFEQDPHQSYDELVLMKDIPFFSLCAHHMVPFFGVAHVGYIPQKKLVGLSKLARLVDLYARRLQIQERITRQVVDTLDTHLEPKGSMCVIEARHLCAEMRGVRKAGMITVTSAVTGVFLDPSKGARDEFLRLIR